MTVYANKPAFNIREKLKELDKPIGTLAYQDASAPIINSLTITDNTSSVAAAFPNPMLLLRGQYPYLVFQDTDTVTPGSTSTLHGHQSGTIYYDANNPNSAGISGGHSFRINGAAQTIMLLNTDGMDLQAGRIKFPATQNASTNANTLDDYEEGTWTPAVIGDQGGSLTTQSKGAWYTKIGNIVHVFWEEINWSANTLSGLVRITGLPYASRTQFRSSTGGFGGSQPGSMTFSGQLVTAMDASSNSAFIVYKDPANNTYSHTPTFASSGVIYGFSLTYMTTT